MLRYLSIQQLILIEKAELHLSPGLNILSGETGAGKSAIMVALALLMGEKAQTQWVRHGASRAVVEGLFDITSLPDLQKHLMAAGIELNEEQELLIHREIGIQGERGKIYINHQLAQRPLLESIAALLIDRSGQHAYQRLFSSQEQLEILDLYGECSSLRKKVSEAAHIYRRSVQAIAHFQVEDAQRQRDLDMYHFQSQEIQQAQLKEDEDEVIFSHYQSLSNAKEISSYAHSLQQRLNATPHSLLPQLIKVKQEIQQLLNLAPTNSKLQEIQEEVKQATILLQESAHTIDTYASSIEVNPKKLQQLEERLSLIDSLKKKYGANITAILEWHTELQNKIQELTSHSSSLEELRAASQQAATNYSALAQELTLQRTAAAKRFEEAITAEIQTLAMPSANFQITLHQTTHTPTPLYEDGIEFLLSANRGEKFLPLRQSGSGGELSRIMLAILTLIANQRQIPTLLLDEVDANMGGETAVIIGEKIAQIGKSQQVLCITHLAQVAYHAEHHFFIQKHEEDQRTYTTIILLEKHSDAPMRQNELQRLLGGKRFQDLMNSPLSPSKKSTLKK